jgi:hypothetical protein
MGREWKVDDAQRTQPSTRPDVLVARRAAEEWSVLSFDELLACGLSPRGVVTRCRNGRLHRLYRGVYAVGHGNPPLQGRFLAAVKACGPDAVVSHFSAAALWGLFEWDDRYPEVTLLRSSKRSHRGLVVHRAAVLALVDIARHQGIPVTSPARTVLDVAPQFDDPSLRRLVRRAQGERRTNVRQLAEALGRLGPRPGAGRVARIIATGPAPTRSELEDVVLDLILHGGLAHPDVNVPLVLEGRRVIPDFRWPDQHLVLEADGAAWHDNPIARRDDADRQALLERCGERVLRVTWEQAIQRRSETLTRLRAAGAPRPCDERPSVRAAASARRLAPRDGS